MSLKINSSTQKNNFGIDLHQASEKKENSFSNILSHSRQLQSQEMQLFLERLEKQGQKLSENRSLENLTEFKTMVKSFLQSTFGKSRNMQEETFWDYRGQPKVMARVTKINKALEELGEQVLSSQSEPLKILEKIHEIKGLIIDLFT
ncbi:MAG: YaaR family protein [Dehalobacter sp.]|nr:YaaR family protein [Dehalobacter sp.]